MYKNQRPTFVSFTKNTAATWSINKILPVSKALHVLFSCHPNFNPTYCVCSGNVETTSNFIPTISTSETSASHGKAIKKTKQNKLKDVGVSQPAWLTTPSFPRKLMHEMHGKGKKVAWNEEITYTVNTIEDLNFSPHTAQRCVLPISFPVDLLLPY